MREITIRRMRPRDIEAAAAITEAITRKRVSKKWKMMVAKLIELHSGECLVAEKDGEVIGFILGEFRESGFGTEKSGWIEVLGVHPKHMGRGVGNMLGQRLLAIFKRKGATGVFTAVRWDSGDLLAFFRSIGFDRSSYIILEKGFD
ncbi:MAG: GNAT family N-acetyltransferase [Thermoplasmata archaeon]